MKHVNPVVIFSSHRGTHGFGSHIQLHVLHVISLVNPAVLVKLDVQLACPALWNSLISLITVNGKLNTILKAREYMLNHNILHLEKLVHF